MRKLAMIGFLILFFVQLNAQVKVLFRLQNPYELSYDDVTNISLISRSEGMYIVQLNLKDEKGNTVFDFTINGKKLEIGSNQFSAFEWNSIAYGNSEAASFLLNKKPVTVGRFTLCLKLTTMGMEVIENNECVEVNILEPIPMRLLSPENESVLNTKLPLFRWIGVLPPINNALYQLKLVEVKANQSIEDAISSNVPVIFERDLSLNILNYNVSYPELIYDKKYAWQVWEYVSNSEISRSMIWTFTLQEKKIEKDQGQYLILKNSSTTQHNVFHRFIRLSYTHPNTNKKLDYSIQEKSSDKLLEKLPDISINTGLNYIDIPLNKISGIKKKTTYILKIKEDKTYIIEFEVK